VVSHDQRVGVVTGASRGIGAAVACELARRGVHVVLLARTQGGLEEVDDAIRAEGGSATLLPIDLADDAQLDPLGPTLLERFGRLDILVHNAGALGRLTPTPHILPRDWATAVGVNLNASWRLIRSCGPLLQAAPAGRAVFVTSRVARAPRAYWGAYAATKAGMEALVLCWAAETAEERLRINLFDPGPTRTRMRAEAMPGEDPQTLPTAQEVAPLLADACDLAERRHGEVIAAPRRTA
jgi:NAD(P)-dependent dehydrogenase (short-subunit alcohol dehydrogenase family)